MKTVEDQLRLWQKDLLDLSNRNRLINFREFAHRPNSLQILAPEITTLYESLLDGKSLTILGHDEIDHPREIRKDELQTRLEFDVHPSDAPQPTYDSDETSSIRVAPSISARLRDGQAVCSLSRERAERVALRLKKNARASEQEQGVNILFASFGMLQWSEKPNSVRLHAPLILLPLEIEENTRTRRLAIRSTGEDASLNLTLAERLRYDFGLDLTIDIDEDKKLQELFDEVRSAIAEQDGWDVIEHVHVALFPFYKLRMYQDLSEYLHIAANHDVIQILATRDRHFQQAPHLLPHEEELDRTIHPKDDFTFLDADSSQMRAIRSAINGSHLIIDGPPGTGKSQTIANIIAESIARGKTVLFVSEKAVALEVVYRRLAERGLDEFCLELHSHKASKHQVISELANRLEFLEQYAIPPAPADQDWQLDQLARTREHLNSYVDALHSVRQPLGKSVFEAHGDLAACLDVPYLESTPPAVTDLTLQRFEELRGIIQHASEHAPVLHQGIKHPWAVLGQRKPSPSDRALLSQALKSLLAELPQIRSESEELAHKLHERAPTSLESVRRLLQIAEDVPQEGTLRPDWLDPDRAFKAQQLAEEATRRAVRTQELATQVFENYQEKVLEVATPEAIRSYEQGGFARFLSFDHRRHRAAVRAAAKDGQQRSISAELSTLRAASEINDHLTWFRQNDSELRSLLGIGIDGSKLPDPSPWMQLERLVSAAGRILSHFQPYPVPPGLIADLCQGQSSAAIARLRQILAPRVSRALENISRLESFFDEQYCRNSALSLPTLPLNRLSEWLQEHINRFDELTSWIDAQTAMSHATQEGLGEIVQELVRRNIPPERWKDAFTRLVLTNWLSWIYQQEPSLYDFSRTKHEKTVEQFRELDLSSIKSSVQRIRHAWLSRQGQITSANAGEPMILKHEARKRRRQLPLRKLFERIPNLLPTLKPCLMMSPLSVSHFLPPDRYVFDVVIFDEASQVRPHDAIGAIMRGKQIIVAGDEKQLPPTSFFDRVINDEVSEEDPDDRDPRDLESILDALQAKGIHRVSLKWHYRSQHEDLIAFSNHKFYDGRLITFPTPTHDRQPGLGVRLEYVPDGRYMATRVRQEKGGIQRNLRANIIEASRVAELVMRHAHERPQESLGVVAFNINQRDAIEEALVHARSLDRSVEAFFQEDRSEPFFVKSLEFVQGDERDVIIISVGFAKNEDDKLSHNFGPINQKMGPRRLNVLVTRARREVIVVSSIKAEDISLDRTQAEGAKQLKAYLDFAENGPLALEREASGGDGDYESPFEEAVGTALEQEGYTVHRQVGCSGYRIDLAIVHPHRPGRYILGLECDGKTYHQSKTARDRDRLRQDHLERLGWTIHRIWSTDWFQDPAQEIQRVRKRIDELLASEKSEPGRDSQNKPRSNGALAKDVLPVNDTVEPSLEMKNLQQSASDKTVTPSTTPESMAKPYQVADLQVTGVYDLPNAPISDIAEAVVRCVEIEGPIHRDLLVRRITTAWGYSRAGQRIVSQIQRAIRLAWHRNRIEVRGDFLWPVPQPDVYPRGAMPDGRLREIAHIADEELISGVTLVLKQAFSLTQDELVSHTARLFGYSRTGSEIKRRLQEIVQRAASENLIQERAGRYQLVTRR